MGRKVQVLIAALIAWPAAAQEYNPTLIPAELLGSPQTMTPLNGGDDSTRLVQFAFPFSYYGQTFTSAWVSTNGFVSFQGPDNLCCDGLPMEQAQRNTIYGYWTDLTGGSNPYYRMTDTSALFGWYGTQEYGSWQPNTFEINLSADGKIQFNYGALANVYHTVSAGITGPTQDDNIQLFYGQNVQNLSFQSGLLSPNEPAPVPDAIDPAPDVTPDPTEVSQEFAEEFAVSETGEFSDVADETVSEEVIVSDDIVVAEETEEEPAEDANDLPLDPAELAALAAVDAPDAPTDEEVAQAVEVVGEEAKAAEAARVEQQGPDQASSETRRDRNVEFFQSEAIEDAAYFPRETVMQVTAQNVAFVAQADAQDTQLYGEQTTTEMTGSGYILGPTEGPTFAPPPATGMGDFSTPIGQAQQMELLGMQAEMASGQVIDVGDVNDGDKETMSQLAAIPAGYSAYTQARIPDAPFYQPRDIYKGRRIPDQNMALFRMMRGQDALWEEMVDTQYE
jgi:hypothetical protein